MLGICLALIDDLGDKICFEALYRQYNSLIMWIALRRLDDYQAAEDCVQETFLYIAKNFDKVDKEDAIRARHYIATVADGFAVKAYHHMKKLEFLGDDVYDICDGECSDCGSADFDDVGATELSECIDKLPDDTRTLLYLTYSYGYKSSEIASMFSVTEMAVRKRLQRARGNIRTLYEEGQKNEYI